MPGLDRDLPPVPYYTTLHGTVREGGTPERDHPVARVTFHDVTGDTREMDFTERTALDLAIQLLIFVQQLRS